MCIECREPLEVAQSPQADSERGYIRGLIAQGETKPQILQNLVAPVRPRRAGQAAGARIQPHRLRPSRWRSWSLGAAILVVHPPALETPYQAAAASGPAPGARTRRSRRASPPLRRRVLDASRRLSYIASGALTPSSASDSAIVVSRGDRQRDPRRLDRLGRRPDHAARLVERREVLGELERVAGDPVRRSPLDRLGDLVRKRH